MKRTLAALAGLFLLLAGCTGSPGPSPTLLFDQPDPEVVHVKLVITAHVQTTVHYSNGDMTTAVEMAPDRSTGTATAEFDAPIPWVVAATATAALSAPIDCELFVDGKLVDSTNEAGKAMFAMCAATQAKLADPEEGNDGAPMVGFYSESKKDVWAGWATERYTDSRTETGFSFGSNEAAGPVRLVVVPLQRIDPATCSITISGQEKAADQATGLGDIATCSATVD